MNNIIDPPPFYNLPRGQRRMMEAIIGNIREKGESPTLDELATALGRAVPNVHKTLKRLEERGLILREKNGHRGITLPEAKP